MAALTVSPHERLQYAIRAWFYVVGVEVYHGSSEGETSPLVVELINERASREKARG